MGNKNKRLSYERALAAIKCGIEIDEIEVPKGSSAEQLAQCYIDSFDEEWIQHIEELWIVHTSLRKTLQKEKFAVKDKKPIIALDAKASLLGDYHEALRVMQWLADNGDLRLQEGWSVERLALRYAGSFEEEREWILEQMGVENETDLQ